MKINENKRNGRIEKEKSVKDQAKWTKTNWKQMKTIKRAKKNKKRTFANSSVPYLAPKKGIYLG